jgi:O-antigen ligase
MTKQMTMKRFILPVGAPLRDVVCMAAFQSLLVFTYFISKNTSAKLMIAALVVIVATDSTLFRERLPRAVVAGLAGLAAFALWSAAGLIANGIPWGRASETAASFVLLGLVILAGRRLLACCDMRLICLSIVAIASLSALASIVLHLAEGQGWGGRLVPLGRPGNSIPGAGGLCIALIAAVAVLRGGWTLSRAQKAWLIAALVPIVTAVVMTQSRGPMIAVAVALAAMVVPWRLSSGRLAALALASWALVTSLIFADPYLRSLFCTDETSFCRPSARLQIWGWVVDHVASHPVFGLTPVYRFEDSIFNHPHNGLLGTMMFFGIPGLALFLALALLYSRHIASRSAEVGLFASGALIFSFGYMGSDLSNPFAFANTHYLFLWLPLAFGLAAPAENASPAAGAAAR